MNPIITLPDGFTDDMLAYVGQLFTDLNLLILVVLGIPVAFWIISKVIGLVRRNVRS